jgi:UDP-glucose 4-epimerase
VLEEFLITDIKHVRKNAFNETMGAPVNVLEKLNTLKKDIKEVGSKEINPIVTASKPSDITSVIQNIEKAIRSLEGTPYQEALHNIKNYSLNNEWRWRTRRQ